ncbi:MAG: GNAT family N-acetyltransferase [Clostridiales bacterium]|nr:GNAT family N-acetyltransferase [Clostridiales bacterium]
MDIMIKKADISDLDELMKWREIVLRAVFSIPYEKNIDELLAANKNYYQSALEKGEHVACFAHSENQIVGCGGLCIYNEMPSPDNPTGICGYLMNIYTVTNMRRRGVAKAVVEWLIREAKDRKAHKIYLEASEEAYSLYKKSGFSDMNGYMKYNK